MTACVAQAHRIPIAPKQEARREAGLCVEALNDASRSQTQSVEVIVHASAHDVVLSFRIDDRKDGRVLNSDI